MDHKDDFLEPFPLRDFDHLIGFREQRIICLERAIGRLVALTKTQQVRDDHTGMERNARNDVFPINGGAWKAVSDQHAVAGTLRCPGCVDKDVCGRRYF